MMQDEELIRLYVTRSERAIALTSDKYGGYCHTIAYQILKDLEDSDVSNEIQKPKLFHSSTPSFSR